MLPSPLNIHTPHPQHPRLLLQPQVLITQSQRREAKVGLAGSEVLGLPAGGWMAERTAPECSIKVCGAARCVSVRGEGEGSRGQEAWEALASKGSVSSRKIIKHCGFSRDTWMMTLFSGNDFIGFFLLSSLPSCFLNWGEAPLHTFLPYPVGQWDTKFLPGGGQYRHRPLALR